jgi:hypothetical protein
MDKLDFNLYPFQMDILNSVMKNRYTVVNCSRRVGKSYGTTVIALLKALNKPNQHILIVSPTQSMTLNTYWKPLLDFLRQIRPFPNVKVMEKEIWFENGSSICLGSADKIDKLRGRSPNPNLIIMDEFSFVRSSDAEELFVSVLQPYSAVKEANCKFIIISTPKGYNFYKKLFDRGNDKTFKEWNSINYSCYEARPDLKETFDNLKLEMDPKQFNQELLAQFITEGNAVFINFDDLLNLKHDIAGVQEHEPLVISVDQNVGLMSCIVARVKSSAGVNHIEIINEHEGQFKDIPSLIGGIRELYPTNRITITPDSSMAARSAAAGIGNDSIKQLKQAGFNIRMDKKNPGILDSINVANAMLLNGNGIRQIKIHPKCTKLIEAIKSATWNENTGNNLVKDNKTDHLCDCFRYLLWYFKRTNGPTMVRSFHF